MVPRASRFRAALDEPSLIEAVAEACRELRPQAPHTVTPAAFDALLSEDEQRTPSRFAGVPRALSVRRRLAGLGWYELLGLIFDSERSAEHYLALRRRPSGRPVAEDECVFALRTVASRLGLTTVRPHEFVEARSAVVVADARAWLHGTGQDRWFPTAAQIEGVFRTDDEPGWDRALSAAGLEPLTARGRGRPGVPVVRAMELFLADIGCLPWSRKPLEEYTTARGFSLAMSHGPWSAYIAALRVDRDLLGLWTPPAPPPPGNDRPSIDVASLAEPAIPRRHKLLWTDMDVLIAGVMKAYDLASELDRTLTQPLHRQLAKENPSVIPSPSVVDRNAKVNGRTAEWVREEAKRRRRERDKSRKASLRPH